MTTTATETEAASTSPAGDDVVVARAGRYYRNTRYLFVLAMLIFGAYFAYDGWVAWPREAQLNRDNPKAGKPHTDTDIRFQKVLGFTLPPLALAFLGWTLYRSRGSYRLQGDVLSVPGHPEVPLDAIRQVDKSKWDRKGIAYVDYELHRDPGAAGAPPSVLDYRAPRGRVTLDDFIYDRAPTDQIVERIEAFIAQSSAPSVQGAPPAPEH